MFADLAELRRDGKTLRRIAAILNGEGHRTTAVKIFRPAEVSASLS
jgi:hypothetical protein